MHHKIVEALGERAERLRRQRPRPVDRGVAAGDVRLVSGPTLGDGRLALILKVNSPEVVQFTLVHPYVEYATDSDIVVPGPETGLLYDLVTQGDIAGVAWTTQLGPLVGQVPLWVAHTLGGPNRQHLPEGSLAWRGPRLTGPLEARWKFKEAEGEALSRLAADCTATMLGWD